jgi:hypothetical protein
MANGIYLLHALFPLGTFSQRFSSLDENFDLFATAAFRSNGNTTGLVKSAFTSAVIDTLLVSAPGYNSLRKAITMGTDTSYEIRLTLANNEEKVGDQIPADLLANSKAKNLVWVFYGMASG